MPVSTDIRNLGQRAAGFSAVAIVIKSLNFKGDASHAMPILEFTGSQNAAVLIGLTGIASTGYFLLRALEEGLVDDWESEQDRQAAGTGLAVPLDDYASKRSRRILNFQRAIKWLIAVIDFWLPIILSLVVTVVLWRDALDLGREVLRRLVHH